MPRRGPPALRFSRWTALVVASLALHGGALALLLLTPASTPGTPGAEVSAAPGAEAPAPAAGATAAELVTIEVTGEVAAGSGRQVDGEASGGGSMGTQGAPPVPASGPPGEDAPPLAGGSAVAKAAPPPRERSGSSLATRPSPPPAPRKAAVSTPGPRASTARAATSVTPATLGSAKAAPADLPGPSGPPSGPPASPADPSAPATRTAGGGASGGADRTADLGGLRAQIHARILRAREYPDLARRRRQQGQVRLRFRIVGGQPTDLRVVQSAGALLDAAALETVRRAAPLPAYPGDLELPVAYRLD